MTAPSQHEIERQYRVAKQTMAMHADLRDQYARIGLFAEGLLLILSVVSGTTAFAGESFYERLGISPTTGQFGLGVLSVVSLASAIVLLACDPRGRSARHKDAADEWWQVVDGFRRQRNEDKSWPLDGVSSLAARYSQVCSRATPIPDRKFNSLKSRYLIKIAISRFKDSYPACPTAVLRVVIGVRDTFAAFRRGGKSVTKENSEV